MSIKPDAAARPDPEALSARINAGETITVCCVADACLIQPTACKTSALGQLNRGGCATLIDTTTDGCEYNDCGPIASQWWVKVAASQATGWVKGECCSFS